MTSLPPEIQPLSQALSSNLQKILETDLYAIYLFGALTFPESGTTGDIDFHAILHQPPTSIQRKAIISLHDQLAATYPPLGAELDGYYLLLADARAAPPPQHLLFPGIYDNSWALHRQHIRQGRYIALFGPDPPVIYLPPSWEELDLALKGELEYITKHLGQHPAYCVLNLCRINYSYRYKDVVVSKRYCADWAMERYPQWANLVQAALSSYDGSATSVERQLLRSKTATFYQDMLEIISQERR